MKTRLLYFWESVRTSFWFIPGLMAFGAIAVSFIMVAVDRRVHLDSSFLAGLMYVGGPEETRAILSTIAASMITVAGVTFSITIVALTLASSQFGPRLLRNFMKDRGNQIVLGTFIAAFMYCLLVLRSVHSAPEPLFVPSLSVSFAIALALANLGVLIFFIHHVSASIQADRVIASVYAELLEHIERLFPEELAEEIGEGEEEPAGLEAEEDGHHQAHHIPASHGGYLQAVDRSGLVSIARKNDFVIHLRYRPGEFVMVGSTLATVRCTLRPDESLSGQIAASLIVGPQRLPEQDAEFAVHQLVEIAVRALSPGINDPYTAISCTDWLGSALCHFAGKSFPSAQHHDEDGKLRVVDRPVTFLGITNAAFDQIRQYGRSSAAVTIRLLETLAKIAVHTRNSEQRQAILRQADMVAKAGEESLPDANDRLDVQERYRAFLEALGGTALFTEPSVGQTLSRKT